MVGSKCEPQGVARLFLGAGSQFMGHLPEVTRVLKVRGRYERQWYAEVARAERIRRGILL